MARLRVGDVEIDGSNVTITGQAMTGGGTRTVAGPSLPTPVRRDATLRTVDRVPGSAQTWSLAGVAALATGASALLLFSATSDPLAALARGGFLAPLGVGMLGTGALKVWVRHASHREPSATFDPVLVPYLERARALLAEPEPTHTIEWLRARTGWDEHTTVTALIELRRREELEEALDEQSGEFHYRVVRRPRDLDTRLTEIL